MSDKVDDIKREIASLSNSTGEPSDIAKPPLNKKPTDPASKPSDPPSRVSLIYFNFRECRIFKKKNHLFSFKKSNFCHLSFSTLLNFIFKKNLPFSLYSLLDL